MMQIFYSYPSAQKAMNEFMYSRATFAFLLWKLYSKRMVNFISALAIFISAAEMFVSNFEILVSAFEMKTIKLEK